jgi:Arc/MetJ-type ribon-helix-helix transcriptional regulator
MRMHLVGKNVAADIADKLCRSVLEKLDGTHKGSFQTLSSVVRKGIEEALTQILSPKRHIDVIRDIREAQQQRRPFVITFCGVNGMMRRRGGRASGIFVLFVSPNLLALDLLAKASASRPIWPRLPSGC